MNLKNTIVLGLVGLMGFSVVAHNLNVTPIKEVTIIEVECNKTQAILTKYKNAKKLTQQQLKELLSAVGFKGYGLKMAWAIAMSESSGRPTAHAVSRKTGDNSYGLFQINMIGTLGPDRREAFNLKYNGQLFDPVKNAQIAYHMSKGGLNWTAWKNGKTPRAKEFLQEYKNLV